jgi:predicted lipid-binding transport protein (Tim44 family)
VKQRWDDLVTRDPALDWGALMARIDLIFRSFHEAWTKQELALARPYLSDNLFQTQRYWVEAYQRQKLKNLTDGARIVAVHLARVVSDARYDAITVRVFATGLDYTVDERGEVVGGSKARERAYSEYWTLIRGVDRAGAPRATADCPSCGADLDVNMAGVCRYCDAKVTAGEFDWVLSRIEQDEAYG